MPSVSVGTEIHINTAKWKEKYPSFVMTVESFTIRRISDDVLPKLTRDYIENFRTISITSIDGEKFTGYIPVCLVRMVAPLKTYEIWHDGSEIQGICRKDL